MNDLQTVTINQSDISVKEYQGKRVVTFKDIDLCHGRPEGTARKRFNDNKAHFVEGEDFFKISPSEIRTHKIMEISAKAREDITLVTESGYLMLVKSFTDDLAWDVQRQLVNTYFKVTKPEKQQPNPEIAQTRAAAMMLNAKSRIANQMMKLWTAAGVEPQYQALAMNDYYEGLSVPRIAFKAEATAMYDLTTIAQHLGIMSKKGKPHAQAIGAIVSKLTLEEGEYELTPYSRNGHDDVSMQYTLSVEHKVKAWLEENNYPNPIPGNGKNFTVKYRED
jgi:hypothetical protein